MTSMAASGRGRAGSRRRFGALLIEMVVCCLLLSTVAVILTPIVRKLHQQQKMTRFETLALTALNNIAADVDDSTSISDLKIDDWFLQRYPDAELNAEELEADEFQQPVRLTVRRPSPVGNDWQSRSLLIWREVPQ